MSNHKKVRLIGGTYDGKETEVLWSPGWIQPMIYLPQKISPEGHANLHIQGEVCWKPPDDVYVRNEKGEYAFSRVQHYKPDDVVPNSTQESPNSDR